MKIKYKTTGIYPYVECNTPCPNECGCNYKGDYPAMVHSAFCVARCKHFEKVDREKQIVYCNFDSKLTCSDCKYKDECDVDGNGKKGEDCKFFTIQK